MHMQNMTLKCMFNKFSSPTGIHRGLQQVFQTSRTYVWGGFVRRLIGTNGMVNVLGEKDNSHLMYMRRPNRHPQFLPWYTTSRIIAPSPRRIDKDAHSKPNPQLQLLMKMTSVRFRDWSEPALVVKTQLKHPVLPRMQVFTLIFI
jgi:hypothetical protein